MAKTYAWNNIVVERDEWGRATKTIPVGDEVDQKTLKVGDDEWEELLAVGAVRDVPYPEDVPDYMSPHGYVAQQVVAGEMTLAEGNEALGAEPEPAAETEEAQTDSKAKTATK